MHAAPGYQNPGDHSDNIDSNSSQPRNSVKFWDGNNINIARQVWRHIAGYFPWSFKKMSHDKTLWTVLPNAAYNSVKNSAHHRQMRIAA